MAWVVQSFSSNVLCADLHGDRVDLRVEVVPGLAGSAIVIEPRLQEDAHAAALVLRRAARRLEEIGKELP